MTSTTAALGAKSAGSRQAGPLHDLAGEQIVDSSQKRDDGLWQTEFVVPGMHCAGCMGKLERGLGSLEHVASARANLSTRSVTVIWDKKAGPAASLSEKITGLGFDHFVREDNDADNNPGTQTGKLLLRSLAVAGFAAANVMLLSVSVWSGADAETAQLFHLISGLIAIPAVAYAGRPFFNSAIKALSARRLNMDVPISLAVLLALAMSLFESVRGGEEAYFDAAVTLLFFLLIGRYLDHLMREKARDAVTRLSRLTAKGAMRLGPGGRTHYVALQDIEPGMTLRIQPGERLPVNGKITTGTTEVDRSLVTGESDPIARGPGDQLEAGILNIAGSIDIEATSSAQNSFLAEMAEMMKTAENGRGRYVGIADRMARIYAPAVHLLALVTFIGWMFASGGDWHMSIYTAIAVLIITCPCALGLAVPVVHVVGAQQLMKNGILIRDGSAFERLSEVDTVIFDKTGTLTMGVPTVTETSLDDDVPLPAIKALASRSGHPAAKAVSAYLAEAGEDMAKDVSEIPGYGVEGRIGGRLARFGKQAWVAEISLDNIGQGNAAVGFAFEGGPMARFSLADRMRDGAAATIDKLAAMGLATEILSGDHDNIVAETAGELSVRQYAASTTPAGKIEHVRTLQEQGRKVLMVGDGLNDAPALAEAHAAMAPGTGCDIGRYAADFVFTHPDLRSVSSAYQIARKTGTLIRQNFAIALVYNSIAVPLAMAGLVTPLIAAIAMSTSSIVVIANALRLSGTGDWKKAEKRAADFGTSSKSSAPVLLGQGEVEAA